MKIVCPDCKEAAELSDDFSFVKCESCKFEMTYGEYVKYIAYRDVRYRDILSDYKSKFPNLSIQNIENKVLLI